MKTIIITLTLLLSSALICAQTQKKGATVHIKKIEKINGVEKITDTTYTVDNPQMLVLDEGTATLQHMEGEKGKMQKVIIIDNNQEAPEIKFDEDGKVAVNSTKDTRGNREEKNVSIRMPGHAGEEQMVINIGGELKPGAEDVLIHLDSASGGHSQVLMIKKAPCGGEKAEDSKEDVKIIVVRQLKIVNASEEDLRTLNKNAGATDGKLSVEKMDFYPNPNNGRFNLSFTLPEKGDTDVKILNENGMLVFSEKLPGFSGSYSKEVDITRSPKGVYFVRVEQGSHALVKKIIVD